MASSHRVTDLEKIPVRISKNEAPTPLSVVGPLLPPCYFIFLEPCHVRGVSVFFVLCTQLSQQARPHQGACLLLGVLFYFPNLSLFVSSYVKMKKFCSFQFLRLAISWPPWVRVWVGPFLFLLVYYRFLSFTVFSLGLPFCFSSYIVHLRCTSEGGSLDV